MTENKTQLTWMMVIIVTLVGGAYYIAEGDPSYECKDKEESVISLCWKLSKINLNDISTRCYFNPDAVRTYTICKTGWISYTSSEVIGNITTLKVETEDEREEVLIRKKLDFKDYPDLIGQPKIIRIWRPLGDNTVHIRWQMIVWNNRDNKNDTVEGYIDIPKEQINDIILIQELLESDVKKEFEIYNRTFIPNPIIEYEDHILLK